MSRNDTVTGWIYDVRKRQVLTVSTKTDKEPILETWYKISWCKMTRTNEGRRSKFVVDKIPVRSPTISNTNHRRKMKHRFSPITTSDGSRVHTWVLEKLIPESVLQHVSKKTGRANHRELRNVLQSNRRCRVPKHCHPIFSDASKKNISSRQTKLSWVTKNKRKSCGIASSEEECSSSDIEPAPKKSRPETHNGLRVCTQDGFAHPFTWYVRVVIVGDTTHSHKYTHD